MSSRSLTVVAAVGSAPRTFVLDDAWVNEFVWSRDSRSIYFQANDGTFGRGERMFDQPVARVSIDDGRAERIASGATVDFSISLSQDGRRMAYKAVEGRTMGDVVVLDVASRRATKVTDVNPELHDFALGDLKPITWRSFDGMEIWGLLLTPSTATPGRRLPLLVYVHGGPGGGFTHGLFPQFMHIVPQVDPYPTAALASAGFAVLFPMPRGGAGYGEAGQRAIVNAWGDADYKDIMTGVDALVAQGIADGDRLGVMGASYGGYMTNWIVGHTGMFKAAVTLRSISNFISDDGTRDGAYGHKGDFGGDIFEKMDLYWDRSPLKYVKNVTTPILILHSDNDYRVPIEQGEQWFRALKHFGKTAEIVFFPRENHNLTSTGEPKHLVESLNWQLYWFDRYLNGNSSAVAPNGRRASVVGPQ
jgi:dipeptidyl aminopeptidase/acylaminoacyl peptidase